MSKLGKAPNKAEHLPFSDLSFQVYLETIHIISKLYFYYVILIQNYEKNLGFIDKNVYIIV